MTLATEPVACGLCGSLDREPYVILVDRMLPGDGRTYRLVRCRHCGLLTLDPRPTADDLAHAYPDDYAPFARRGFSARVKSRLIQRTVAELWPLLRPPARVLDLGCATGELLDAIRARGNPSVVGVEPSPAAARVAHDERGLDVHQGTLESAALPADSVDVALLSHVLEHLPSPNDTLRELARVLRPNGTLVLWLPNADSLAARVLRERWMGYDAPRHLHTFSVSTLSASLERAGFGVLDVRHEWIGLEWSWGLRYWVRDRWASERADRWLARLHPLMTAALTPVAAGAAAVRHGGRIQVIARAPAEAPDQAAAGSSSSLATTAAAASASRASLRSPNR